MRKIAVILNIMLILTIVVGCEREITDVEGTLWMSISEGEKLEEGEYPATVYKFDGRGVLRFRTGGKQWTGNWEQSQSTVNIELDGEGYSGELSGDIMDFGGESDTLMRVK